MKHHYNREDYPEYGRVKLEIMGYTAAHATYHPVLSVSEKTAFRTRRR